MALYWPEARVAVASAGTEGNEEWPSEVIVISLRPGQVDDPCFIDALRELVRERALERRRGALEQLWEMGRGLGEVRGGELREGEDATEAQQAEARLRELICGDDQDERAEWGPEDVDVDGEMFGWGMAGFGLSGPERQIVVGHCGQLVVRG